MNVVTEQGVKSHIVGTHFFSFLRSESGTHAKAVGSDMFGRGPISACMSAYRSGMCR